MPEFIKVREAEQLDFHYMVLKMADYVFSTRYSHMQHGPGQLMRQLVNGEMGGVEHNIWLRSTLTETVGHAPIVPTPVEVNIYYAHRAKLL